MLVFCQDIFPGILLSQLVVFVTRLVLSAIFEAMLLFIQTILQLFSDLSQQPKQLCHQQMFKTSLATGKSAVNKIGPITLHWGTPADIG